MKNTLILSLFILCTILFTCRGERENRVVGGEVVHIHKLDTIYKEIIKERTILGVNKTDTIILRDSNDVLDSSYIFSYNYKDSLLEALILARSTNKPIIEFEYKLKQLEITKSDSIYNEVIINPNKLYIGSSVTISPLVRDIYLNLNFAEKNGNLFGVGVGYDLVNNHRLIGFSYSKIISFKKNR